jgi:hypothetical protein
VSHIPHRTASRNQHPLSVRGQAATSRRGEQPSAQTHCSCVCVRIALASPQQNHSTTTLLRLSVRSRELVFVEASHVNWPLREIGVVRPVKRPPRPPMEIDVAEFDVGGVRVFLEMQRRHGDDEALDVKVTDGAVVWEGVITPHLRSKATSKLSGPEYVDVVAKALYLQDQSNSVYEYEVRCSGARCVPGASCRGQGGCRVRTSAAVR